MLSTRNTRRAEPDCAFWVGSAHVDCNACMRHCGSVGDGEPDGPCRGVRKLARRHFSGGNSVDFFAEGPYGALHHPPPPLSPPFLKGGGGWGGGGCPHHPRPDPAHPSFFEAMQQNARSLWPSGGQFARVVKGVDLRSTAGNCAWVRTPQLASLSVFLVQCHLFA